MGSITEKELDLLFPEHEVEIAGHMFVLRPFSFVETKVVSEKLKDVLHLFVGEITPVVLTMAYGTAFEGVRDVIAMSLNIKPQLVEKFDQKSALKAITEIIRVNKSFFVDQVETTLEDLQDLLGMEERSLSEK